MLRDNLGMRYKKIKKIPFQGNSGRCLVLRQLYAKQLLGILNEGKRVINIDETWLPQTDFRNRKWKVRGQKNSQRAAEMRSKVNAIAALDTDGKVYLALTQVNTDSNVMLAFLSRLAITLTSEGGDWRSSTVFVLDGAPYHKSNETRKHI